MHFVFRTVAFLCVVDLVVAQDLFLAARRDLPAAVTEPEPASTPSCPPLKWIKQSLSSGAFIVNYSDISWGAYLTFLNVTKSQWPNEFNATDIWQYAFYDTTFIMNHTIPGAHFHLLYEASTENKWEKNPYPYVTPAGFDKHVSVNLSYFRNAIEKPGVPHRDSCWALRTDMPVVSSYSGVPKEYVVTFWRELTSPEDIRCTLHITDAQTNEIIEPWKSQMGAAKPFPGYSYRYFRRAVQSFPDVEKRLKCAPTGLRSNTQFC